VRRGLGAVAAALVLVVVGCGWFAWRAWNTGPAVTADDPATVVVRVRPGATLPGVAAELHARGLLEQPRLWLLAARLIGRDRGLQVGRYAIPRGASPRELLAVMLAGRPLPVVITLPEGQEAGTLAAVLGDSLGLAPAAILACADSLVCSRLDTLASAAARARLAAAVAAADQPTDRRVRWCEGYLAPDTYHIAEGTDARTVARTLVDLQLARIDRARQVALPPARTLTAHEFLTLAAIVEAEARRPDERARIAAVYHNRLRRGMRLEADPTVAYWLGKRGERLLYRDLEIDSPYNTYRRAGLPAGPIACPGQAALLAAARPDTTCDALYFVADGAGGHVFSRTLREHEAAVGAYRRLLREHRR